MFKTCALDLLLFRVCVQLPVMYSWFLVPVVCPRYRFSRFPVSVPILVQGFSFFQILVSSSSLLSSCSRSSFLIEFKILVPVLTSVLIPVLVPDSCSSSYSCFLFSRPSVSVQVPEPVIDLVLSSCSIFLVSQFLIYIHVLVLDFNSRSLIHYMFLNLDIV